MGGGGGKLGIEGLMRAGVHVRGRGDGRGVHHARASGGFPCKAPSTSAAAASIGGTRQYLPLKVNQAGVMPIIFASSLLMFPHVHLHESGQRIAGATAGGRIHQLAHDVFHRGDGFIYNVLYLMLIYFFCYFWTAITFNPKDMADNLKNFGSFIPGYRPGKRTADYLEKVMVRITYVGAGFLAVVAIIPTLISTSARRRLRDRQLLRRHQPVDRRQRGLRPGAENR